jgi:hypothetical protein
MDGSLYLDSSITALDGYAGRMLQIGIATYPPATVLRQALTGFVPSLHKIMVNVDDRGPC